EDELLLRSTRNTLRAIHDLKREMIWLRKSVWPLREAISRLERGESSLVQPGNRIYFRDVYDHTVQVIDLIETFRELLAGMLEMYLSSVSNRLNEVMKVLTIITTIFIPLTFVTSIYGMNFHHMPEIDSLWGYPTVLAVMAAIAGTMVYFFRKKRWI
ncbi:MAG: magnesium/cobalt transporter CorA, partial [Planctomycetes bacterium]|nr:magnesium/cobalt transporter CorA [Planctomycetota bacterium]